MTTYCVPCPLGRSHTFFLCPPGPQHSITPIRTIRGHSCTSGLTCVLFVVGAVLVWTMTYKCVGSAQVCLSTCLVPVCVCEWCCMVPGALSLTMSQPMSCFTSFLHLNNFFPSINSNFTSVCKIHMSIEGYFRTKFTTSQLHIPSPTQCRIHFSTIIYIWIINKVKFKLKFALAQLMSYHL